MLFIFCFLYMYFSFNICVFISAERLPDWTHDVDTRIQYAVDFAKKRKYLKSGDNIVIVTGWRQGAGATNTMRIITIQWSVFFMFLIWHCLYFSFSSFVLTSRDWYLRDMLSGYQQKSYFLNYWFKPKALFCAFILLSVFFLSFTWFKYEQCLLLLMTVKGKKMPHSCSLLYIKKIYIKKTVLINM